MTHFFDVEIAKQYGIEKAVLLQNFYYWTEKNKANGVNIHGGRAYTFNTSEALAQLFPYLKPRKIAELLRQMEFEDQLLISGQFHNFNRVKSYALTDKSFQLLGGSFMQIPDVPLSENGQSNIQNSDVPLSNSCMLEDTEIGFCSITNNKPNNKHTNNKPNKTPPQKKQKFGKNRNVLLTENELQKLIKDFGRDQTEKAIDYLSSYKIEKDYKTKSDNLTLRRWVFDAIKPKAWQQTKNKKSVVGSLEL